MKINSAEYYKKEILNPEAPIPQYAGETMSLLVENPGIDLQQRRDELFELARDSQQNHLLSPEAIYQKAALLEQRNFQFLNDDCFAIAMGKAFQTKSLIAPLEAVGFSRDSLKNYQSPFLDPSKSPIKLVRWGVGGSHGYDYESGIAEIGYDLPTKAQTLGVLGGGFIIMSIDALAHEAAHAMRFGYKKGGYNILDEAFAYSVGIVPPGFYLDGQAELFNQNLSNPSYEPIRNGKEHDKHAFKRVQHYLATGGTITELAKAIASGARYKPAGKRLVQIWPPRIEYRPAETINLDDMIKENCEKLGVNPQDEETLDLLSNIRTYEIMLDRWSVALRVQKYLSELDL